MFCFRNINLTAVCGQERLQGESLERRTRQEGGNWRNSRDNESTNWCGKEGTDVQTLWTCSWQTLQLDLRVCRKKRKNIIPEYLGDHSPVMPCREWGMQGRAQHWKLRFGELTTYKSGLWKWIVDISKNVWDGGGGSQW